MRWHGIRGSLPLTLGLAVLVVLAGSAGVVLALHRHPEGATAASRASGAHTVSPTGAASARTSPRPTQGTSSATGNPSSQVARTTAASPSRAPAPPTTHAPRVPATTPAAADPVGLPLDEPTGDATQVVTVVAPSTTSTTASVQAWSRHGSGWRPSTGPIPAHIGTDGLTTHPSERRSATPIGSFTLTQAFGADSDPGTSLPYLQTNPSDWWISQPGPLYNTHQRCSSGCAFTQGTPNEHLYFETPSYNYGVVIDYNTANAGPVVQGAGSAFFLHVYAGIPSAGCVAIAQDRLVSILRWLTPADHPRILIGIAANAR